MQNNPMLRSIFCTLLVSTCANVSAGEFYNAKNLAQAGVGVAGADFAHSALLNPALPARGSDNSQSRSFNINASVGILGSDEDELIDNLEELEDELDDIDDSTPSAGEVEGIVDLLNDVNNAEANFEFGSYFQTTIPNDYLSLALFVNLNSETEVSTDVDTADIAALNAAAGVAAFDSDTINSQVLALAVGMGEYGLSLAKTVSLGGQSSLTLGISPKFQAFEIYDYRATFDNYDEDDIDNRSNRSSESHVNADVGLHFALNKEISFGAVVKNINEDEFVTEENRRLDLDMRATVGAALHSPYIKLEANVDLDSAKELLTQQETQWLRLGAELDVLPWSTLRLGGRYDLEDNGNDLLTFGLGFQVGRIMTIDAAVLFGENESYGGLVQFGFQL